MHFVGYFIAVCVKRVLKKITTKRLDWRRPSFVWGSFCSFYSDFWKWLYKFQCFKYIFGVEELCMLTFNVPMSEATRLTFWG